MTQGYEYFTRQEVQTMSKNPGAYALTAEEYTAVMQADCIIDQITKQYITVDDNGNSSIVVTAATMRELYSAFKKEKVSADSLKALVAEVFTRRKWYSFFITVDEEGQVKPGQMLLTSDNEQRYIPDLLKHGDESPAERAEELGISPEYKYIPSDCWQALKQLLYLFEQEQTQQAFVLRGKFRTTKQGPATNALTKISTLRNKSIMVDAITGLATIERGGLTVQIADYVSKDIKLKASTHRLLDALTVRFAETGGKGPTVEMPLKEYMELCDLKDEKEARKQVKEDLEALYSLSLSYKGKGKHSLDFVDFRLCDYKGIKNGVIFFNFSRPMYGVLMQYPIMRLPDEYFKLNSKRNPNSSYFLRKISEQKNMNAGTPTEDIISVQTLLNSTDELPKYEDIASTGRIDQRIIRPFERDLDALSNALTWEYCHSKGAPLTAEELLNMDYALFSSLLIKITWVDYPAEVAIKQIERREKAKANATPKKRGRPRKNPT